MTRKALQARSGPRTPKVRLRRDSRQIEPRASATPARITYERYGSSFAGPRRAGQRVTRIGRTRRSRRTRPARARAPAASAMFDRAIDCTPDGALDDAVVPRTRGGRGVQQQARATQAPAKTFTAHRDRARPSAASRSTRECEAGSASAERAPARLARGRRSQVAGGRRSRGRANRRCRCSVTTRGVEVVACAAAPLPLPCCMLERAGCGASATLTGRSASADEGGESPRRHSSLRQSGLGRAGERLTQRGHRGAGRLRRERRSRARRSRRACEDEGNAAAMPSSGFEPRSRLRDRRC